MLQAFLPRRGCVRVTRALSCSTFHRASQRSPTELRDFLTELRWYSVQLSLRKARPRRPSLCCGYVCSTIS